MLKKSFFGKDFSTMILPVYEIDPTPLGSFEPVGMRLFHHMDISLRIAQFDRRLESGTFVFPGRKRWTSTCKSCGRLWMVTLQIWKNGGWPHPDVELGINFEWGKRPFKPQISRLFVVFVAFIVLKSVAELYWWTRGGGGQGAWDWLALLTWTDQEVFCCFFFNHRAMLNWKIQNSTFPSEKKTTSSKFTGSFWTFATTNCPVL